MLKISAVIISYNEEKYIGKCLDSLHRVADEIVVVDSYSQDKTKEICKTHEVKFIEHEFEGYKEQKNWAMAQAENNIVLSLDADEYLSEKLEKSIQNVKNSWEGDAYSFNRLNNYYGKWIKHSGVYPDRKLRLFDRRKGKWGGVNPHDRFILNSESTHKLLAGDLLHFVQDSIEDHLNKIRIFSTINALEYHKMRKKSSLLKILIHPSWRFFKSYFLNLGFLDGYYGFKVCSINAYLSYLKHIKIRKLNIEKKKCNGKSNTDPQK